MYDTRNPEHDFNYEAILSFSDAKPSFRIPALGIIACGDSVDAAYRELERLKAAHLDRAREADLLDTLPRPVRLEGASAPQGQAAMARVGTTVIREDLRTFAAKLGIVCLAIAILFGAFGLAIKSSVNIPVGKKFWAKAAAEIHRAALPDRGMDPAAQAALVADLHAVVAKYKPFVDAVEPLFAGDKELQGKACP